MEFFYEYVQDAIENKDKAKIVELNTIQYRDISKWMTERLEEVKCPKSIVKHLMEEYEADDKKNYHSKMLLLWQHIQDVCADFYAYENDEEEEEEEDKK
jgi:hypothetical protein